MTLQSQYRRAQNRIRRMRDEMGRHPMDPAHVDHDPAEIDAFEDDMNDYVECQAEYESESLQSHNWQER